jgi:hypothetical protein
MHRIGTHQGHVHPIWADAAARRLTYRPQVACVALLAIVWHDHCRCFRRYGLKNTVAVILNCALLLYVLFYVYP